MQMKQASVVKGRDFIGSRSLCTYRRGGHLHDSSAASSVFIRFLSAETRPEEIGAELSQGSWDCCSSLEEIKEIHRVHCDFVLEQHNGSPARNTVVNISLQEIQSMVLMQTA